MLGDLFDFLGVGILKFILKMPSPTFNFNSYVSVLRDYLGFINWFVPFNQMAVVFTNWLFGFIAFLSVLIVIKVIFKFGQS